MPADVVLKTMNTLHKGIKTLSMGRFGWEAAGMPVLELTTTGAKSGQPRTCQLTSPLQDGDSLIIVASRGGDDHHPAWYHNLVANPEVTVTTKDGTRTMTARVADDEERAELWQRLTSAHGNYAAYQTKTDRVIPVVVLEPRD